MPAVANSPKFAQKTGEWLSDGRINGDAPPPTEGSCADVDWTGSLPCAAFEINGSQAGSSCVTPFNGSKLAASSVHALTSRRRRNQLSRLRRFNRAWGYGYREAMCLWHNETTYNLPPPPMTRPPPGLPLAPVCEEDNQPLDSSTKAQGLLTRVTQFVPLHSARDGSSEYSLTTPTDHIVDLRADADLLPLSLPLTTQLSICDIERDADDSGDGDFDTVSERLRRLEVESEAHVLSGAEDDGTTSCSSEPSELDSDYGDSWFDVAHRVTRDNPAILGDGSPFYVHHSHVFHTLVSISTATEDQLILQFCNDFVGESAVETTEELLEITFRISNCVADLITAGFIRKHGNLLTAYEEGRLTTVIEGGGHAAASSSSGRQGGSDSLGLH